MCQKRATLSTRISLSLSLGFSPFVAIYLCSSYVHFPRKPRSSFRLTGQVSKYVATESLQEAAAVVVWAGHFALGMKGRKEAGRAGKFEL